MTRREAFALTACAAAGRLPLLGAPPPVGTSPVRGYLAANQPGQGAESPSTLTYAVLRWRSTKPATGETSNLEIGRLNLRLRRRSDHALINVTQTTRYSKPNNRLEAEMVCNLDPQLSLKSWKLESSIEERNDCLYKISGRRDGDTVHINDGLAAKTFEVDGPLVSQWTLPLAAAPGQFALLEDLSLYKPAQRLQREPDVIVPYRDSEHSMTVYSQRGPAVLPLHYYSDEHGRVQLVTQGALAWALVEAS